MTLADVRKFYDYRGAERSFVCPCGNSAPKKRRPTWKQAMCVLQWPLDSAYPFPAILLQNCEGRSYIKFYILAISLWSSIGI